MSFSLTVEDVFSISGRGTVVTGRVQSGSLRVGEVVRIEGNRGSIQTTCTSIEKFRQRGDVAELGENVGLLLADLDKSQVAPGDVISTA